MLAPRRSLRRFSGMFWLIALCAIIVGVGLSSAQSETVLPDGFRDALVTDVEKPTALAFTPDGRMLITSQPGQLRIFRDGSLIPTPALDVGPIACTNSERGLLGVAVDPDFATNNYIYVYYTARVGLGCLGSTAAVNRVSRWTLGDNNQATAQLILINNIPSPVGNHNGGDIHFGQDGYLYISVGDGGCDYADIRSCASSNDAAREQFTLLGKILRITNTGGIPADNPFVGGNSARCGLTGRTDANKICQETFAWGLRNPFRIAFRPGSNEFYINDVGQALFEEIDLGQAGADYGWNEREGFCRTNSRTDCGPPPAGMINPIHAYGREDGCVTITGGVFVPSGVWPSAYNDVYLFGDYGCGTIFRLTRNSAGEYGQVPFASELGTHSATSLYFGPYRGSMGLYYTSYAEGGQIRAITYTWPYKVLLPTITR